MTGIEVISGVSGLLGVLIGALITWKTTQIEEKRKNAVSLYSDFASVEMENVRHRAFRHLNTNLKSENPLTFQEMHNNLESTELIDISRILHFWEKTWYFIDSKYIDEQLTKNFLRHYFESHYVTVLKDFSVICRKKDNSNYQRWVIAIQKLANKWDVS